MIHGTRITDARDEHVMRETKFDYSPRDLICPRCGLREFKYLDLHRDRGIKTCCVVYHCDSCDTDFAVWIPVSPVEKTSKKYAQVPVSV